MALAWPTVVQLVVSFNSGLHWGISQDTLSLFRHSDRFDFVFSPCLGKRELVFVLIVHLFVSYAHVNLCHCFSSSWYQGLAATSACGSSWTFLLTFFFQYRSINLRDRQFMHGMILLSKENKTKLIRKQKMQRLMNSLDTSIWSQMNQLI